MKRRSRNKRGSMLVLTVFAMFLLVIAIAVLSGFVAMLLAHQRLQDQAEEFEMRAVQVLNESDRTGRINLMTAASRELVFDSRRVYNCVAQNSPAYMPLAQFYLNQSRDGARLIAQEREKILACTLGEMRGLASDMDKSSQLKKLLPWASTNGSSCIQSGPGLPARMKIQTCKRLPKILICSHSMIRIKVSIATPNFITATRPCDFRDRTTISTSALRACPRPCQAQSHSPNRSR